MFYYLEGTIAELLPGMAVVDCGGVGYACRATTNTLSRLQKGERKKLFTWLNVGEGIFDLYGFATQSERNSFLQLIAVSGVGPKAALSLLSVNTPESLAMAIVTGDEKPLTMAPGIGKKSAQRIILELKDRFSREISENGGLDFSAGGAVNTASFAGKASEAAQALSVLGFSSQEIGAALKGIDVETLSLQEIIRQALKKLAPAG